MWGSEISEVKGRQKCKEGIQERNESHLHSHVRLQKKEEGIKRKNVLFHFTT
jgi:hypothetical protein